MPFDFLRNTEFADMPDNLGHLLDHVKGVGDNECVCTITSFPRHSHLACTSPGLTTQGAVDMDTRSIATIYSKK